MGSLSRTRRRDDEAEQAARARRRLSTLRPRRGWVPRVPAAAADLATLGVQAERMDVRPSTPAAPDDAPQADHGGTGDAGAGDADEQRVGTEDDGATRAPSAGAAGSGTAGRYRAGGGAVADRLPLPLRALADGLPSGVRSGEAGLQRMHAVVIGLLILAGLGVALVSSGLGGPDVTPVEAAPTSTTLETGTPVPAGAPKEPTDQPSETVVVHVAGEVARPGIVELPAGARVVEAVEAAGGANDGVDLSTLNLARVVVDGEQVAVGIEPVAEPVPASTGDAAEPVVNLNTAAPAELESLPGIGPALAENIIAWRDEHGRFTAIEELQEVSGIGPATLAALADRVRL